MRRRHQSQTVPKSTPGQLRHTSDPATEPSVIVVGSTQPPRHFRARHKAMTTISASMFSIARSAPGREGPARPTGAMTTR